MVETWHTRPIINVSFYYCCIIIISVIRDNKNHLGNHEWFLGVPWRLWSWFDFPAARVLVTPFLHLVLPMGIFEFRFLKLPSPRSSPRSSEPTTAFFSVSPNHSGALAPVLFPEPTPWNLLLNPWLAPDMCMLLSLWLILNRVASLTPSPCAFQ